MEYIVNNEDHGFEQRKYSNETMRSIRRYIDRYELKADTEGYNETIDRIAIIINDSKLRTEEEKLIDVQAYLEEIK